MKLLLSSIAVVLALGLPSQTWAQLQVTSMSIDAPQFSYANGTLVQNCQKEICVTVYNNSGSTINRGVRLYLMQGTTQVGEILAHAFTLGAFQSLTICPSTPVVGISAFNGLGGNATSAPGNYTLRLVARTYSGSPSTYDLGLVYIGDPGSADAGGSNNQATTMVTDATGNCNQSGVCENPVAGSATSITASGAFVTWSGGTQPFDVRYRVDGTIGWTAVNQSIGGTQWGLTGLNCGTTYNWQVMAHCSGTWVDGSNFNTSACPPASLVLTGCITVNPTSPVQGSAITATATVTNTGGTAWSGEVVLQLLTDQGAYLTDLDLESGVTIQPNGTVQLNFSTASVTSAPGNYQLRVQYQASGTSTWTDVPQASCTNPVNLTVLATPSALELTGCITVNPTSPVQGSAMTATATVTNTGGTAWSGEVVLQLLTDQGAYLTDLDLQNTTLQANGTQTLTFSTANVVSQPGTYQIRIQYQTGGSGAWQTVTAGSCTNPELLTVIAAGGLRLTSDISATAPQFSLADGTLVEGCYKEVSFTVTNTSASAITRGIQLFLMDASNSTVVTNIFAHAFTIGAGQSVTFDPAITPVGINSFNGLGGITTTTPDSYNLLLKSYVTTDAPAAFDLWLVTYAASFDVPTENCGGCVNPQPIEIVTDATGNCNTPVGIASVESSEIHVWPNPVADGMLRISGLPASGCDLSLYDVHGRTVAQSSSLSNDSATLQVAGLPGGIYILRMAGAHGTPLSSHRIVKTN